MSFRLVILALCAAVVGCAKATPVSATSEGAVTAAGASAEANAGASGGPSPATSAGLGPGAAAPDDELTGKPAPDFTAIAQTGATVHLAALRGHAVVLYFYPKDETPGCTKEACAFRDKWTAIAHTGATLVGISADSLESHKAFARHHELPFLLVSDPTGAIAQSYGVPFSGYHTRQTIVVGPDGTIRKVFRRVEVEGHADQVLDAVTHLS